MRAYKRAKCDCGFDTNIVDDRSDENGYAVKVVCKKCGGRLKLSADWIVRGQINGETIKVNCGSLKKDADLYISERLRAKHTEAIMPKKEPTITWEEAIKVFETAAIMPSTREYYANTLKSLGKEFKGCNLTDITVKRVTKFIRERKTAGLSARTIAGEIGTLKRIFALVAAELDANKYEILHRVRQNIDKIEKPQIKNCKDEFFTSEEIKLLISHAPEHLKLIIRIQAETGLRPGNVYRLKFSDISDDGTIYISSDLTLQRNLD